MGLHASDTERKSQWFRATGPTPAVLNRRAGCQLPIDVARRHELEEYMTVLRTFVGLPSLFLGCPASKPTVSTSSGPLSSSDRAVWISSCTWMDGWYISFFPLRRTCWLAVDRLDSAVQTHIIQVGEIYAFIGPRVS